MNKLPLVVTRWTTQSGRRRAALEPGYVKIDERSFPELLAIAPRFAKYVRYVDLDDAPDGDWSDFFRADIAMVLAAMMTFDAEARAAQFRRLRLGVREEASDARKLDLLKQLFGAIVALPREVDGWLSSVESLEATPAGASLRRLLTSTIRHELRELLEQLRAYGAATAQSSALGHSIEMDCHHLHHAWGVGDVC